MTRSGSVASSQMSASRTVSNRGSSMDGIPSFGGPPEMISDSGTLARPKSVFQLSVPPVVCARVSGANPDDGDQEV